MSVELLASLVGIGVGLTALFSRVGSVYHEIKETKYQIEYVHKDLIEMRANDKDLNSRLNHIEGFLAKTTDFNVR